MIPCLAAARVKLSSPSGCPSFPRAVAVCLKRQQVTTQTFEYADDVYWHSRRVTQNGRGPIDFCYVTQNSWPEPDPEQPEHEHHSSGPGLLV
jgi:hypothetical protein